MEGSYFEVITPLGMLVRTTADYWARIVTFKHPTMRGQEERVKAILRSPGEVRRSKYDPAVHLYYGHDLPYYLCIVVKHLNGEGFIVTAYRTDTIKEGDRVWPR